MSDQGDHLITQIVIAGGGPTGLSLAAQLLRHKVDFILIEKNASITTHSKALVVQARTLEIFKELGIAERALREGEITTALNLFYKGKNLATINISGVGKGFSAFPFALSLEQSKTEKILFDYISERGKKIEWNSEITHFNQNESGVVVYYKDATGHEQRIDANYLVGCDGASSFIRHQLGLSFEGTTEPKLFYVADVVIESSVINKNEIFMFMIRKGFVLFFPMEGNNHYRMIGVLPEAKNTDENFRFDDIAEAAKTQIISPVDFKELRWFSTYKVHSRKADSFIKGRCFIAGDAAHIHTPAGGQGMNTGIQDAYNLAWKLAYNLRKEVNEEALKTYNTERTQNAKYLLRTTDRMFDIGSGVNPFWNFIRLNFLASILGLIVKSNFVRKRIFPLISQTGIAYPQSFLTERSSLGSLKAGNRISYFVFSDGREIFSYLTEPVFKLLFFGDASDHPQVKAPQIKLSFLSFKEIPQSIFGSARNFYILLRPDNHISYIGKDLQKCNELFNKIAYR